jgi:integrase
MNTTKKELNFIGKEEKYYYKKKDSIVYNDSNHYFHVLNAWKSYLLKNNYTLQGAYQKERKMIYFLNYLECNNLLDLTVINKTDILNYLNSLEDYYRPQTLKSVYKDLRVILRFLHNNDYISTNLSIFVPSIRVSSNSSVPSFWQENEIKEIFSKIKLEDKNGKRLYLALLMAYKYGLRVGDIKNLKFSNLDWNNRKITIIQNKTKNEISFPMLPEFIDALSDYVKNARPKSESNYIILNKYGNPLTHSYNFHLEIKNLLKKTNITKSCENIKKIGIHSMRHTLASSLLKENIPLPIISTILGHSNTASTTNYLKIDKTQLSKCCLNLKEVKLDD